MKNWSFESYHLGPGVHQGSNNTIGVTHSLTDHRLLEGMQTRKRLQMHQCLELDTSSNWQTMQRDIESCDVGFLGFIEHQMCCCFLDHLQMFDCTCWKSKNKSIAVIQSRNEKFCSLFSQEWPDLPYVAAWHCHCGCCNVVFKGQLVINDYPTISG